jgi:hypothetical protein
MTKKRVIRKTRDRKTRNRTRSRKSDPSDTLIANEHKLFDSFKNHDVEQFSELITPESWRVGARGGRKMQDYAKNLKDAVAESFTLSDVKVIVIDANSAIVTYTLDQIGSFQGNLFATPVYASTVWAKRGSRWHIVFHHETPVAKS